MGLFGKKTDVETKKYLFKDSKVYYEYKLSIWERIGSFLVGTVAGGAAGYIFYSNVIIAIAAAVIVGIVFVPMWRKRQLDKQINRLKVQFRDWMEMLSTSIGAGKNIVDSIGASYDELRNQYSDSADMVKEVQMMVSGMNNNINIETLLLDLGERSGIEDIVSFANVFEISYRKGGNLKEVMMSTYSIINDKMEIDMEIETMVTSSKTEQRMMVIMPIVFVFILKSMGGALSGQGTTVSVISTTVALIMFAIAYFVSKKIMTIKL